MPRKAALDELLQYIRILILDDDDSVGMSTLLRLQQADYPYVEYTGDVEEAWKKLPYSNILLVDHFLLDSPENGIEFTKRAKAEYAEDLDVIIYSGSVDKLAENAKQAGATACLEKPLNFDYLELWIKETAKRIWYEKILNAIPDEVIVIEPGDAEFGKLYYVNKTKKDRFEKGRPLEYDYCWKRFEQQGDGTEPCHDCLSREAKSKGRVVRNYWNYKNWDGENESVDIHAAPIFDQVGKIRGIIETCRDRTMQRVKERNLRRIETENDWAKRLTIFLNGFSEFGYNRVRFYREQHKHGREVYQGIFQVGMPDDFDIHQYCYDAETDMPTQIISKTLLPTLFLVKYEGDYPWQALSTAENIYRVSHHLVPNNHILEKQRWIDIPVIADRKIMAKVCVEPDDPDRFISNHDLTLLGEYADWAGQALWNAEQREKLRLKDEMGQAIIQMNQKISKMPVHGKWVYLAMQRVNKVLDTSACSLFLLEGLGADARLVRRATYVRDVHGARVRKFDLQEKYRVGESIVGSVFKNGRFRRINDLTEIVDKQGEPNIQKINLDAYNYYCDRVGEKIKNAMCVTLRSGTRKWGVIRAINKRRADIFGNHDFTRDDLHALQALAGQIAVGLETNELIKELQASQEFKEFIAQEYSHTLKNLMQPVISISGLLQDDPNDQELWELLENEIKKMKTTINTMLQLVRSESTQVKLRRSHVHIQSMLQDMIKPYNILAADKNMEIRLVVEEDMHTFFMDDQLVYDAMANLLDNAIKYGYKDTYIKINARVKYEKLFLSVADVGEKIAEENRSRIFDKFFLGTHNVAKIRQLGLGLTYVKVVAEAHGGKVYVDPRFKKGAKIILSIPLISKEEERGHEKNIDH